MQKLYSQGGVPTGADIPQPPGSVPEEGEGEDDDDTPPPTAAPVNNVDELD